ncbi:PLC-like phosphodiesterase [Fomitiporia mediterranea MF3/22]|uniref:PLC-like phosphodiesterase n=1 Tax=Fomitiporia mediterranea (strain MF3/22) TaxID=694068 RepID=UPI0004408970|nr:PLC-like phosphodiesterase [Fomitiporia mediterranea MF3/22]EJD04400.1 PLC-like phosphodiesterase [Fomitiporia mediterranea MF3/22]
MTFLRYLTFFLSAHDTFAPPAQEVLVPKVPARNKYFDIQAHRGGRGNTVENTLPSFAWGLIHGSTTLELDNGITKDGTVAVWHDEEIIAGKCQDTVPAFPGDPDFPYVGKYIANLTLAQLKTLDCGSRRQNDYPFQLTYPGTRISTLQEVFDFVSCTDPDRQILWNIESKVDARFPNRTKSVREFVQRQHKLFENSGYKNSITYQSFDWRTLSEMKKLDPTVITSALIDDETAHNHANASLPSPWLAGLDLHSFPGPSIGEKISQAAHALGADFLSPSAESYVTPKPDPAMEGYVPFTTREMVKEAQRLGLEVKVWTVNRLNIVEEIMEWGIDGIITDHPDVVRRWAQQASIPVAPKYPKQRVLSCLAKHLALQRGES